MCQILPFTLPCCRRTYVEVSKLPSCPDAWPENKCPAELCIQVRYEAENRDAGTCWRCQAEIAGVSGEARENLRPEIDSAMIVHGLDEFGVSGRRRMAEEGGTCWYCGAKTGCQYCALIKDEVGAEQEKLDEPGKKRQRCAGGKKDKTRNKRIKVEPRDNNQPQTPAFSYPDPSHPSQWQNVFPTPYSNTSFPASYGFTQAGNMTGFGIPWGQPLLPQAVVTGTTSLDWAVMQNENDTQIGFGQASSQGYTNPTSGLEQQSESLPNGLPHQFQYPDPTPDVEPMVQPEVGPTPYSFGGGRNRF